MDFEQLKGMSGKVTTRVSEAATSASEVSQVAAEKAIDQMLHALDIAAKRVGLQTSIPVPSVHLTASVHLGVVSLTVSMDVPIPPHIEKADQTNDWELVDDED